MTTEQQATNLLVKAHSLNSQADEALSGFRYSESNKMKRVYLERLGSLSKELNTMLQNIDAILPLLQVKT